MILSGKSGEERGKQLQRESEKRVDEDERMKTLKEMKEEDKLTRKKLDNLNKLTQKPLCIILNVNGSINGPLIWNQKLKTIKINT